MKQNLFEDLQAKKQELIKCATQAADFGWIPQNNITGNEKKEHTISLKEIKEKLDKDTLTIGVIGQMKCGKSTFLNSFVFKDNILPAATTPMTAALSVITYGEREHIVAEFYTQDEWEEQKMQARRDINEVTCTLEQSKIKAAKELVSKASKLGTDLDSYLGKIQEDGFKNLIEYVGADGKFVSITKAVTIYYPHEYLKGVEVVDTPGFNDPIVSREERTKAFLKRADVVIMMLYAGRPFDATDRDIILKNVRQCGIGKVLVGINKYDIPYCSETNPESEEEIKQYVREEIRKTCKECNDDSLIEILNDIEPIPLSAQMALLSQLPMSEITSDETLRFAWERYCNDFEISTQQEMYQKSHLDEFIAAVKNMIEKEKEKILFSKSINAIKAAGNDKKKKIESEVIQTSQRIKLLNAPDSELEDKEKSLNKVERRMQYQIEGLTDEIIDTFKDLLRKDKYAVEDEIDKSCKRMRRIIKNEWGAFESVKDITPSINDELETLKKRKIARILDTFSANGKKDVCKHLTDFFIEIDELLLKIMPDFDYKSIIRTIKNGIKIEIEKHNLFDENKDDTEPGETIEPYIFIGKLIKDLASELLMLNPIIKVWKHDDMVVEFENRINSFRRDFTSKVIENWSNLIEHLKTEIIETTEKKLNEEIIEPLRKELKEVRAKKEHKEQEIEAAKAKLVKLQEEQRIINMQWAELGFE